jgi:poly-D-alanine transfer protein DltD
MTLYAFWLFFFALVWYLHRENKREGYPLVDSHNQDYEGGLLGHPGTEDLHHATTVRAREPCTRRRRSAVRD